MFDLSNLAHLGQRRSKTMQGVTQAAVRMGVLAMALLLAMQVQGGAASEHEDHHSLCSDRSEACAQWAEGGECFGENKLQVMRECPGSCRICSPNCVDLSPDCAGWAAAGQCQDNPLFMIKECPVSCLVCSVKCVDKIEKECPKWAKNGRCDGEDRPFMLRACPQSCGICSSVCHDRHADCAQWTKEGECWQNPGFMLKKCPRTCGVCQSGDCKDTNQTLCDMWGEYACIDTPGAVLRDCPKTCHVCDNSCIDKDVSCPSWAAAGECQKNPQTVVHLCPGSCGICSDLQHWRQTHKTEL